MVGRLSGVLAFVLVNAAAAQAAQAGSLSPAAQAEVSHLLAYLEESGCEFFRNGAWHGAKEARAHLERKGGYLIDRSLVRSADEFIERAAADSSMSGDQYLVRCASRQPVPSADWLRAELQRFREQPARRR